jgi:ligand-binding sensor domain-containing protein/signal transduction histidine kinase
MIGGMQLRRPLRLGVALALLLGGTYPAFALDARSPAASYLRTRFTTEDGLGANVINDILQSRAGFLWIASHTGVTRFDGQHFDHVPFPQLIVNVNSITEGQDGDLWLGTMAGIIRISPRILDLPGEPHLTVYHLGAGTDDAVWKIRFARDGTLWAGARRGLYRWNGGAGFSEVIGGLAVNRMEESPDGHILVPNSTGYVEWDGTRAVNHSETARELGLRPDKVFQVYADRHGAMWFSTAGGLFRRLGGSVTHFGGSGGAAFETYEDHNGNIWVSMDGGVFRVRGDSLEALEPNMKCRVLFADRDGGLWIGANGTGLVHLRDRAVQMFTTNDGLRSDVVMAALNTRSGKLWVATNCGGIAWFDGSRFHPLPDKDHRADCAFSLAEDGKNDLFVGTYGAGVFRLHNGQLTQYLKAPALPSDTVTGLLTARDGSLWVETPRGVACLRDGQLRTYTSADGLSADTVRSLFEDSEGTIWAATPKGVDRLVADRFSPAIVRRDPVLLGEYSRTLYIRYPDGVSRIEGRTDASATPMAADAFPGFVNGDAMIAAGKEFWLAGHYGIYRTTVEGISRWEEDRGAPLDYATFTRADGMRSAVCTSGASGPHLAITSDNRLWVATEQGLAMIDLPHLPRNANKAVVYIRDTLVGRTNQRPADRLLLHPGTSHLELAFDPVELSSPERIRLQYRLDGVDDGWLDAPSTHIATYSAIPPGSHTFHVRATNRDGIWDRVGMAYEVTQEPLLYQTGWFRALCVAVLLGMLWGLYRYRIRQLAYEFNVRLEERVSERNRIARELHDTLLQSFNGLMLQFRAVYNLLPSRPAEARETLEGALDHARQAITEGRDAVQGLREYALEANDLAQALQTLSEELNRGEINQNSVLSRIEVHGTPRELHPIVRDEVYRIACEALRNAFRHAQAHRIETELQYDERQFRLRLRDDGKGIDPKVLREGRTGHFGLAGMRERAGRIGGNLDVWSELESGTEVEMTVPASIAYTASRPRRRSRLFGRKTVVKP